MESALNIIDSLVSLAPQDIQVRVRATLFSFAFLYYHSKDFSDALQAQPQSLVERAQTLISLLDMLDVPDCPEIFDENPEELNYQKLNRYLFDEVDEMIKSKFCQAYPGHSLEFFPSPVVEWAVNILPTFYLPIIQSMEGDNFSEQVLNCIQTSYDPENLNSYLREGWSIIVAHWPITDASIWISQGGLLDRLRCTMCYPARLSLLLGN
jgi:hypothetical protein